MKVRQILGSPATDWAVRFLVVVGTIAGVTIGIQQRSLDARQRAEAECVAAWAREYFAADSARTIADQSRVDALHSLVLDTVAKRPPALINQDVARFVDSERRWKTAVAALPEFPSLRCSD